MSAPNWGEMTGSVVSGGSTTTGGSVPSGGWICD
jgi:hypothetical protein